MVTRYKSKKKIFIILYHNLQLSSAGTIADGQYFPVCNSVKDVIYLLLF